MKVLKSMTMGVLVLATASCASAAPPLKPADGQRDGGLGGHVDVRLRQATATALRCWVSPRTAPG